MLTSTGTASSIFGYAGAQFDRISGLLYINGAYYDPVTGRFLSPSSGGANPYVPLGGAALAPILLLALLGRKKGKIWTGWVVIALMMGAGLSIAACGGQPTPSQPSQPQPPTVPPSPSPSPTPTPVPSATPVPSTATRLPPTPTPCPTPTSTQMPGALNTPILDVPWKSEYSKFTGYHNACGPTALWMFVAFYRGESVPFLPKEDSPGNKSIITRLLEISGNKGGFDPGSTRNPAHTSPPALVQVAGQFGISVNAHENWTEAELGEALLAGKPVLVSNRTRLDPDTGIEHYFVVTGIVGDKVYYNDPLAWTEAEGKNKEGKLKLLMEAWYTSIDKGRDPNSNVRMEWLGNGGSIAGRINRVH